jgi:integrase
MSKRLTDKLVAAMRNGTTLYDSLAPGLLMEAGKSGLRIWKLQKRYPGHVTQSARRIGLFPAMPVDTARAKAAQWERWIDAGIDPADGETAERAAAHVECNGFASVCEGYIAERQAWGERNRRIKDDAREIRNLLVAEWGDRPIDSIKPSDVRALIGKIRKRSAHQARSGWNHLSQVLKWAVHTEIISASPIASLDKKMLFKGAKLGPRQTVLNSDEVGAYWRGASRTDYPFGDFYRMLMLNGLRKSELSQAKWSELHPELRRVIRDAAANKRRVHWPEIRDDIKLLTIGSERFKSATVHLVPLSNMSCAILETLPRFHNGDFLFTYGGAGPINSFSKAKSRLDARMLRTLKAMARKRGEDPSAVKLVDWTNHDLRRVMKTNLSDLGVDDRVSELIVGHARRGLQAVYDRHSFMSERRAALELWAARIRAIAEPAGGAPQPAMGPNVLPFKAKAGAR